jgi:hypothetical protein
MDAMMMQTLVVGLVVAGAALSVGRRAYRLVASARRRTDADGCGGGCGCSKE